MGAEPSSVRVQIVPPEQGGVMDFASALQGAWAAAGLHSVLHPLQLQPPRGVPLVDVLEGLREHPRQTLSVLLHFSGYGYHPRGLCHELLRDVHALRQAWGPRLRLVTLFHELFASGPPWRSAFWLGRQQADIARRLAAMSDTVATNTEHHAQWLAAQPGVRRPIHSCPVFANIEASVVQAPSFTRMPQMVVFGSAPTRARAMRHLDAMAPCLRALGVEGITEIGPRGDAPPPQCWPHRHLGLLPPEEVSQALSRHRWALIDYPGIHLGKSGVFAACASHGCAVVNTASDLRQADGLCVGREYLSLAGIDAVDTSAGAMQSVADAARNWYAGHALAHQAQAYASLLLRPVR